MTTELSAREIQLVATNRNDYTTLLGVRINKVRVVKHDDYAEIKPIQWLGKKRMA